MLDGEEAAEPTGDRMSAVTLYGYGDAPLPWCKPRSTGSPTEDPAGHRPAWPSVDEHQSTMYALSGDQTMTRLRTRENVLTTWQLLTLLR